MNTDLPHATRQQSAGVNNNVAVFLLLVFAALLMLGIVMVFSASISLDRSNLQVNADYLWRHFAYVTLGVLATLIVAQLPTQIWQQLSIKLLLASFVLLLLVLLVGDEINGSRRWINLGFFNLQPSELIKLTMIIYVANYLTRKQAQITSFNKGIVNIGIVLSVIAILLLLQPDFGSFFVITVIVSLMMFLAGIRYYHTLLCLVVIGLVVTFMMRSANYRLVRVQSFTDPWADPNGIGYQLVHALIAIGRGEIFGVGLGASIQKLYYLPHAHNDFIFAVIGEELGLVGIVSVIILFATLLYATLSIARKAELLGRIFASRLALGAGLLLVIQGLIHIGVNLGALPTKGLTLPFVSYGGSSMLICCVAMGMLFAVNRESHTHVIGQTKQRRGNSKAATRSRARAST